jgi:methylenetetrahydrofolate dehydrogenase (NADP+)/methenyltetrahydrofolate cyclohydrolase
MSAMAEAKIIDGKQVAARVRAEVKAAVQRHRDRHGTVPGLATVLVGDDEASRIYVSGKHRACEEVGMRSIGHELPARTPAPELAALLGELNDDHEVHGIVLQLPLPGHLDADEMTGLIDPLKDVDGLTPTNAGLLAQGRQALVPATPAGVMELLRASETPLDGAEAVVVGRSALVGRPLALLLLQRNATVTICHSRTRDLAQVCGRADVLVAAVGRAKMIGGDMVKPGATVIDVGINRLAGGLVGDVDFDAASKKARAITPVPGGVGPMTIAMLLKNTVDAAAAQESENAEPALRPAARDGDEARAIPVAPGRQGD